MKMVDAIPESIDFTGHATNDDRGRSMKLVFDLFQLPAERIFFGGKRHLP